MFSFSGLGFVGVCLEWGLSKTHCFLVNFYSKFPILDKRVIWDKLVDMKNSLGGDVWWVVGEFNSVLKESKRKGTPFGSGNPMASGVRDFSLSLSLFVHMIGLFDFPLLGWRFTWCHLNGGSMSRLDRFLLSDA